VRSPSGHLEEIRRLLERSARDPRTHTFAHLADLYRETGQLPRALEVVEAGLEHHPHYVNARLVHARILEEMGRNEEAVRAFERILEIDPENRRARESLASLTDGGVACGDEVEDDEPARRAAGWLARLDAEWRHEEPAETPSSAVPTPPEAPASPPETPASSPETPAPDAGTPRGADLETATLAALYMRQGLAEQAIGIYERLLARDPYNARLAAGLESARQRGRARAVPNPPPDPEPPTEPRPVPEPVGAAPVSDESIGEFLDALLEGRAPVEDPNGRRADWPRWLTELGRDGT